MFFLGGLFSVILWENYPGKRLNGLFLDDFEVSFWICFAKSALFIKLIQVKCTCWHGQQYGG